MSKYIRLDEATDLFRGIDATMTGSFVADTLESLPTIEVSEDCISREYMLKLPEELKGWMPNDKNQELWEKIKNAPSVVPIAEQYSTDGEIDLGDCNICRFAGCSECDDCINGSQWVRMTKEDEV